MGIRGRVPNAQQRRKAVFVVGLSRGSFSAEHGSANRSCLGDRAANRADNIGSYRQRTSEMGKALRPRPCDFGFSMSWYATGSGMKVSASRADLKANKVQRT